MPERIQLSRRKGWRMPPNTVSVARPGPLGNPFSVLPGRPIGQRVGGARGYYAVPTAEDAVACFREMLTCEGETTDGVLSRLPELRSKNLACWCGLCPAHAGGKPLGVACPDCDPCHGDVLLELANPPCDSGRLPEGEDSRSEAGCEASQSGAGTAIAQPESPNE